MKKKVERFVEVCDSCHKEDYTHKCLGCGKDFCWECMKTEGVEYHHAVHFSGSGDGFYCHECDKTCFKTPLHRAFRAVEDLKQEADEWQKDFQARMKAAEDHLKSLNPN